MGLIGDVVGFDDRIQEEQMHTGNKEHSLNSPDPVNHVREPPRLNIGNVFNCEPRPNICNVFNCARVEMNWL